MMPKVYNKRNKDAPKDAVYVGRPTQWGNPYVVGRDGTREQVVAKYRESLGKLGPLQLHSIKEQLKGKDLVCWCAPEICHADVLIEIANS